MDSINGLTMPFLSEFRKIISNACEPSLLTFFRKISAKYRQIILILYGNISLSECDIKMFIFSFIIIYIPLSHQRYKPDNKFPKNRPTSPCAVNSILTESAFSRAAFLPS